ncbi:hypothetical protein [Mucilaginibacter lappiensis]|uniref:hypothetical protein n=1 Tax=Mucilaginibacter lappiensis TaxID=354630 RepID=UPI003D1DF709
MTNKQIQLSKKLIISNEDEAKAYNIEQWYGEYFKEINYQLEFLGKPPGSAVTNQTRIAINKEVESLYAPRIASKLSQNNPFVDLNDHELELESILTISKTYDRGVNNGVLYLYLVTKTLELLDTIGNFLIIKNPVEEGRLLSVQLDTYTTIYSIK